MSGTDEGGFPTRLDHLTNAADVGGHHGQPEGECLHECDRKALVQRRETEDIACTHDPNRVGAIAEKEHGVAEPEPGMQGAYLGFLGALADCHEAHAGHRGDDTFGSSQEIRIGLDRAKVGDRAHHECIRLDFQLGPHLSTRRTISTHLRHVYPMGHNLGLRSKPGRHGRAHRVGDGEVSVVEPGGDRVGPARRARVTTPETVICGHHSRSPSARQRAHDQPAAHGGECAWTMSTGDVCNDRRNDHNHRGSFGLVRARQVTGTPSASSSDTKAVLCRIKNATLTMNRSRSRRRAARVSKRSAPPGPSPLMSHSTLIGEPSATESGAALGVTPGVVTS